MIDNYDSFTWNLVQYLQSLGAEVRVERNDALTVDEIERLAPERIVIIGQVYGGDVVRAGKIMHGKTSRIRHQGKGVFAGLPDGFEATRYHSLVVDKATLPDALEITAWTENDDGSMEAIMGLRHRGHPVEGVQFHPESILTQHGHALLKNFLER